MKILHLVPNYHPSIGGSQYLFKKFSERLAADYGDEVTVITSDAMRSPHARDPGRVAPREEVINGVRVRRFRFSRGTVKATRLLIKLTRWAPRGFREYLSSARLGPFSVGMFLAVLRSEADVIAVTSLPYVNTWYPIIARKLGLGRPFVCYGALHIQGDRVEAPSLALARRADAYVAYTRFERDVLVSHGVAREKIEVVGLGVDFEDFVSADGAGTRARLGIVGGPIIGFIGRITPYKGVVTLLQAMDKVWVRFPEARVLIAGAAREGAAGVQQSLRAMPPYQRERVTLVGDFDEKDKPGLFAACDVFVTVSSQESFGIVYLEAWAAGKPVVGGRIGAVASVISEGVDGLLVDCDDPEELAVALARLLEDDALRARLGAAGRAKVAREHTWEQVTAKLRAVYRRVAEGESPSGRNGSEIPHNDPID